MNLQSPRLVSRPIQLIIAFTLAALFITPASYAQKKKSLAKESETPVVANTSTPSPLLTKFEQEILDEINLARANPPDYARYLTDFKKLYKGNGIFYTDGTSIVTNEGTSAVDEAIAFLRVAKPEGPLQIRNGLVLAARTHLQDLLKTGKSGHRGSDGSVPEDRLNRFGSWREVVGENIVYKSRSARENVIALIIDDGTANRGHRKNIFKSAYRVIGIAQGGQANSSSMCVITFAGDFVDKNQPALKPTTRTATRF